MKRDEYHIYMAQLSLQSLYAQHFLLVSVEKCREVLDTRDHVGIVLTDLSKAFDCINHELLIAKLQAYVFSLESLTLIQSY